MERTISLPSGIRTRVIDRGSGPALLLLHGNPDNADEWHLVIDALADRYRCIAPDLPGYGATGKSIAPPRSWLYTVANQVAFVDELLRALAIDDVFLAVHDIGGIMGVPWAARNTARLRGVLYTNTVAYPGFDWFPLAKLCGSTRLVDRVRAQLMMRGMGLLGGRLFARQFAANNPQLNRAELDRFTRDFGCNAVAKQTTLDQFKQLVLPGYFDGYDVMLKTVLAAVPTRVLWGLGDPYVPDARAEQLYAASLERLAGVGHWVPIVAAAKVAATITEIDRKRPSAVAPPERSRAT
jgi:haloalkane dehalogenase